MKLLVIAEPQSRVSQVRGGPALVHHSPALLPHPAPTKVLGAAVAAAFVLGTRLCHVGALHRPVGLRHRSACHSCGAVLTTPTISDWTAPSSWEYKGLLLRRRLKDTLRSSEIQGYVDKLAASEVLGPNQILVQPILLDETSGDLSLGGAVGKMLEVLKPPEDLAEVLRQDAEALAKICSRVLEGTKSLELIVEIMGEKSCARWHQDYYVARSIVSYNCAATEFVEDGAVDFWQLQNFGANGAVVKDESRIHTAEVGDLLFIKGRYFPHPVNSLVHRSPERRYHPDGRVMNRLCLKVDVPGGD